MQQVVHVHLKYNKEAELWWPSGARQQNTFLTIDASCTNIALELF